MLPIRITFAGCSTISATRAGEPSSSPSGSMTVTCGSTLCCPVLASLLMPPIVRDAAELNLGEALLRDRRGFGVVVNVEVAAPELGGRDRRRPGAAEEVGD